MAIYVFAVLFARNILRDATLFLVVLPIIGSALGFGLPIAIIPVVVCCSLNLLFENIFSSDMGTQLSVGAKSGGTAALIVFGIALGYLKNLADQLRKALKEVTTLEGLIPMCAGCKKIRDDGGYWEEVESYVSTRTDATFSHGLCPECIAKYYPEYADIMKRKSDEGNPT